MNQEGFDAVIEAQGEALATLHENAAGARQQSQTNGNGINKNSKILLAVMFVSLAALSFNILDNHKQKTITENHINKNFYQACAFDLAGKSIDDINLRINKMFDYDYETAMDCHDNKLFLSKAKELGAKRVADALKLRFELLGNREAFEAIQRMSKAIATDPEGWKAFLNEQN
jgi:hypothetical protein